MRTKHLEEYICIAYLLRKCSTLIKTAYDRFFLIVHVVARKELGQLGLNLGDVEKWQKYINNCDLFAWIKSRSRSHLHLSVSGQQNVTWSGVRVLYDIVSE
jgi:hypothetical protein